MHSLSALNTSTMFWSFLAKWWFESRLTEVSKIMYTDCTIILATFFIKCGEEYYNHYVRQEEYL